MQPKPPLMRYEELSPPADLAAWIAAFWVFEVAADVGAIDHPIPLTGGAILALRPGEEPVLSGPRVHPLVVLVRGGEIHYGVHLLPGAAGSLLGQRPSSLREQVGPARFWLAPAWCESFRNAGDPAAHLLASLRDLAARAAVPDPIVMNAVKRLLESDGSSPIGELALASGLSPRQFRRRFTDAVGLSPKELARLRRVRASAAAAVVEGRSWADAASEHGFADQAHLIREFRSLLGPAPEAFRTHAERITHRLVR